MGLTTAATTTRGGINRWVVAVAAVGFVVGLITAQFVETNMLLVPGSNPTLTSSLQPPQNIQPAADSKEYE